MAREFARDVVRLLDHLKIQRAHVLGYSLGAIIAGRLATMHPERLISVMYVASLPLRERPSLMDNFADDSVRSSRATCRSSRWWWRCSRRARSRHQTMKCARRWRRWWRRRCEGFRRAVARLRDARRDRHTAGSRARPVDRDHRQRRHQRRRSSGAEQGAPAIRTVVVQGAQHGGPECVMRRPDSWRRSGNSLPARLTERSRPSCADRERGPASITFG